MTIVAAGVLAILLSFVVFDIAFRPSIRRIGMRNVTRRAREAALVVGGSMLATALITASFVIGDSFDASIRDQAAIKWGPTDELVYVDTPADATNLAAVIVAADSPDIDGALSANVLRVAVGSVVSSETDGSQDRKVDSSVRVLEIDLLAARVFGDDVPASGLETLSVETLSSLGADMAIINTSVAQTLGLSAGEQLDVFADGASHRFQVVEVVPVSGLAGLGEILLQPGALTSRLADPAATTRPMVLVSNLGGVFSGADQTDAAIAVIENASMSANVTLAEDSIDDVKRDLLRDAAEEGAGSTELFATIGGFSVIAGILLVINLFVMLASERKTELGTMRALGMSRGSIIRSFAIEGAIYGALAAIFGAIAGIGVGVGVVGYASANAFEASGETLRASVQVGSLVSGAVIGLAISQITVMFTSIQMTKLNIVRALKDLPEPKGDPHRIRNLVFGVLGVAASVGLWIVAGDTQLGAMAFPVLGSIAMVPLLSRLMPPRVAAVIGCGAGMAWAALVFGLLPETMDNAEVGVFLLQGVLLVGLGSAIVAILDQVWLTLAERISGNGIGVKLGMAHPLSRPIRSVMLVAMFSLVLFTVTFMGIINAVFQAQGPEMAHRVGGEYQMLVDTNRTSGFTIEELLALDGVEAAAPVRRSRVDVSFELAGTDGELSEWSARFSFVDQDFDQVTPPATAVRAAEFASDEAAWNAVLGGGQAASSDDLWIMAQDDTDTVVGEVVTLTAFDGTTFDAQVAGKTELGWMVGAGFYAPLAMQTSLVDPADLAISPTTRFFVSVAASSDPEEIAGAITSAAAERGVDARAFTQIAQGELDEQETVLTMLEGYLGLGLLIGIAGLSIVLIRAVRERRRQIGMMRAIGISASKVRSMFIVEALFIGIQGVILGIGLGTLSSWQTLTKSTAFERGLDFTVPGWWMAGLGLLALFFSVLAAVGPALRAGNESPAEALRFTG